MKTTNEIYLEKIGSYIYFGKMVLKLFMLFLVAILFLSCESESVTEDTCDCYKLTYVRYQQNEWYHNGSKIYYSDDCTDNGDIVGGYSGQGYEYQYRIECE